ncbi:hypothetical protein FMUND_14865 [Fusarium mundagurra]|uniref:Mg2+ transporter n=1 Tax=Fusarium mundagurra TaxID=1567541 RepID=A0A8H6D153_9HYPO|nr:hypothetical protein FMUND_14865 [Fusarium mundagurra]
MFVGVHGRINWILRGLAGERSGIPLGETYTEWETFAELSIKASAIPDGDYTESPPPIETDGENEEESPRQRQFSYDIVDYGRRYKSRSRSSIHPRYKISGREGYLPYDALSRTAGYNSGWYSRTRGESLSSNECDPYNKFDFSSRAQLITDSPKADDSDVESLESEETNIVMGPSSLMKDESVSNSRPQMTLVDSSAYTGSAEMGGSHAAVVDLVHDPKGQKKSSIPLADVMNFEDFWINRISGLTELEKKAVTRLRADVKKPCVKSRTNPEGAKVGYLDPKYIESMNAKGEFWWYTAIRLFGRLMPMSADECQTWFGFLPKFQAFWPKVPEFWYKNQGATAYAWPRILKLASTVKAISLKITIQLGSKPEPPPRVILRPDSQVLTSTHGGKGKPRTQEFAHMLALATWDARGPQIQAYKTCKQATGKECYEYLVELSRQIEEAETDSLRRAYEEKLGIFNAVGIVYSFFSPTNFQGPMARKLWGAVRSITELIMLDGRPVSDIAGSLRVSLRDLTRNLLALQNLMMYSSYQERAEVDMPPEFSKAWLYITIAIVYGSNDEPKLDDRMRRAAFQHQLDLVQQELVAVKRSLWKQNSHTAIDTEDIVMSQIEHEIVLKEAEKQYKDKRHCSETLPPPHSQRQGEEYNRIDPVSYAREATTTNDYMELDGDFLFSMASSSKLSPTDAGGLRGLFFLKCLRLIKQREFEFRRFSDFSKDLKWAITYKMDFTRDRQERAIYAFTLVTIIFLPISTVSSFFGMNTTDVRDMNYSQWLYWLVAIPVTVLVIVLGLWVLEELGNLARWLFKRPRKGIYGEPAVMSQTVKPAYWAAPPTTQLGAQPAEYSSPRYEPRRRRVQTQANYPARQSRIYRSR